MWIIYFAVGCLALSGLGWLIETIVDLISTHRSNVDELNKMIEKLSTNKHNIKEVEQMLGRLKKVSFFERPSKRKINYCQKLLSPYVVEFIQYYSNLINELKKSLERQDIPGAERLLKEIQKEQSRAPEYCKQYDKSIISCQTELKYYKSIQAEFNNSLQRLQALLDNGTEREALDIAGKLHYLIMCNPDFRKFDKQLLSQLENEIKIKW